MNKIIALCFAAMFLAMFTTGDLIAAEKTKPAQKKAATKKSVKANVPKMIETFLGTVTGTDKEKKTLTVRASYAAQYYVNEDSILEKEFVMDEEDITFDISQARFAGCGPQGCTKEQDIKTGDHVRVAYAMKGNMFIAHAVLKIGKR